MNLCHIGKWTSISVFNKTAISAHVNLTYGAVYADDRTAQCKEWLGNAVKYWPMIANWDGGVLLVSPSDTRD